MCINTVYTLTKMIYRFVVVAAATETKHTHTHIGSRKKLYSLNVSNIIIIHIIIIVYDILYYKYMLMSGALFKVNAVSETLILPIWLVSIQI